MRRLIFMILSCAVLAGHALTLDEIRNKLASKRCQQADVSYEVWLPSAADPVKYEIALLEVNPGDTLSPSDYLIEWKLPRGEKISSGFSSYHGGNHFRYRDTRLQEYHIEEDATPFNTKDGGVQRTAQFVDLLPAFISEKLAEMSSDTSYVSRFDDKACTLSGVRRINGYDALEYTYKFNRESGLPEQLDFVFNPASISEQTVTAKYVWKPVEGAPKIDEAYLIARYPNEFEKFRTSNFRVENLRGSQSPAFSYNLPTGQRVNHVRGEYDLVQPVIVLFADAASKGYETGLNAVRSATSQIPMPVTTVIAFSANEIPDNFQVRENEYIINGPQSFIVKCGVTAFPTILLINTDGTVESIILGSSPDLETTLSQSMLLLH